MNLFGTARFASAGLIATPSVFGENGDVLKRNDVRDRKTQYGSPRSAFRTRWGWLPDSA
jgi:hypothetical protein